MLFVRNVSVLSFSLIAALVGASYLVAEDVPVVQEAAPAKKVVEATPHFRAKQILGAKLNIEGNTAVGTIDDIVLDDQGNVDYLIVVKEDESLVTVPWDAAMFNVEKRIATVHITPDRFNQVPTYTVKQYPVFSTPTYRNQVYKYYGLTPAQERRAFRRGAVVAP